MHTTFRILLHMLLLITSSLYIAATSDGPDWELPDDCNTQKYCLTNTTKNFNISDNELHLKEGNFYLKNEFILANFDNISIIGHDTSIICESNVGLTFINITNITLEGVRFINCAQDRMNYFALNYSHYMDDYNFTNKTYSKQASIVFYNCSLTVRNVSIECNTGVHALMIVNVVAPVKLCSVMVLVQLANSSDSSIISSGIFFHFYNNPMENNVTISLTNFKFVKKDNRSKYEDFTFIAIKFLLVESNLCVNLSIVNVTFANFHNSMGLFYYAKLHKYYSQNLILESILADNNTANLPIPLFYITFHGTGFDFKNTKDCRQKSKVFVHNSTFKANMNIAAIIHVRLRTTLLTYTNIVIHKCACHSNINSSFVVTNAEINSLLQLTHTITIEQVNITNNTNSIPGVSLLSFAHGHAKLKGPLSIKGNHYYENIITVYFAALRFHDHIDISENTAYMLFNTLESSYFVLERGARVEVINNIYHSNIRKTDWINSNLEHTSFRDNAKVCLIQFSSTATEQVNLDDEFAQNKTKINYKFSLSNNRITEPRYLVRDDFGLHSSCLWLADMAFKTTPSIKVMTEFITQNNAITTKEDVNTIPSKICYCLSNKSLNCTKLQVGPVYNCTKRKVGPVFPGQLLKLPLIVPSLMSSAFNNGHYDHIMLVATSTMDEHGCKIENASEIFQSHTNCGCNEYKYTIKYGAFNECELYLRTQQHDTEIFYVELNPCPAGFALEKDMCVCDPLLKSEPVSVLSCNLDSETILRPKNSWITAETNTFNHSHTYHVSLNCPLRYCLPYPSHLKLSDPDSQCQFNRAGILCTQCQNGLSVVFGSPHCKHCSNYYLLIILPLLVITFLLMILTFMFNLTITNGAINIFIFYIDIVSTNVSIYFPHCQSILCIFFPWSDDSEIDTCFYNGMTNYAKAWLYLCYPLYLTLIAALLIIASRYSVIFQRLTAQRALPVLATLFLLSFTGLLHTVSLVLFYFKTIIHIPGNHTTIVWIVDTSASPLEAKFIFLYAVCLIFFSVLLIFNALLLFTKELLQFKIINKIKPFLDVYLGPYKHGFSYWTGLQLLIRIAVFGLTAIHRDMNLMLSTILLVVLLWIQGLAQPFKSRFENFQQSSVLLDIIAINIITLYNRNNNPLAFRVVSILIYAGSFYFVAYVIIHCLMHVFRKTIDKGKATFMAYFAIWKQRFTSKKKKAEITCMVSVRRKIPDVTYSYQEFQDPVIEID